MIMHSACMHACAGMLALKQHAPPSTCGLHTQAQRLQAPIACLSTNTAPVPDVDAAEGRASCCARDMSDAHVCLLVNMHARPDIIRCCRVLFRYITHHPDHFLMADADASSTEEDRAAKRPYWVGKKESKLVGSVVQASKHPRHAE